MSLRQLLLSAKIGDGCYVKCDSGRYYLGFTSVNLDYLTHKRDILLLNNFKLSNINKGKSGYKKDSIIYNFWTRRNDILKPYGECSITEIVTKLNKEGLIYYYLDDGSYHKNKHFAHLYCNTFSDTEVEVLINQFYKYYPIKPLRHRLDRKKDGRIYPYLYIPSETTRVFKEDVRKFLVNNNINSLLYKTGLPSTTIEKVNY